MLVKEILGANEGDETIALKLICKNCNSGFIAHGRNDFEYFNQVVYELACPKCKYQDKPASPCPYCSKPKM